MFDDQKRYLHLIEITFIIISLVTVLSIFVPFFCRVSGMFAIQLLPNFLFHTNHQGSIWQTVISPVLIFFSFLIILKFNGCRYQGPLPALSKLKQPVISCLMIGPLFFAPVFWFSRNASHALIFATIIDAILWIFLTTGIFYLSYLVEKNTENPNIIKHIAICGNGETAKKLARYVTSHPECGLRLVGFFPSHDPETISQTSDYRVLGMMRDLPQTLTEIFIDAIFDSGEHPSPEDTDYLIHVCAAMGIDYITSNMTLKNRLKEMGTSFDGQINHTPILITRFVYRPPEMVFFKRVFDFTASIILISLCLPIYIVVGATIKATSPGPILFKQTRIGKCGRRFTLYKFRSMVADAESLQKSIEHLNEMDGPVFKIKHDPRQTKTGIFIRNTTLDELPQFFNVFKGDISLVGPRPAIENETRQYGLLERKRLSVEQGITCLWQAHPQKNQIPFNEWMRLDQTYIREWSPAMDLRILLKTIKTVLNMLYVNLKRGLRFRKKN